MSVASIGFNPVSPAPFPIDIRGQAMSRTDTFTQPEKKERAQLIEATTEDIQRIGKFFNKKLQFEVDRSLNRVIVKVIDKETDKVIKELPPEELQRLHNNLRQTIGFLFNERV